MPVHGTVLYDAGTCPSMSPKGIPHLTVLNVLRTQAEAVHEERKIKVRPPHGARQSSMRGLTIGASQSAHGPSVRRQLMGLPLPGLHPQTCPATPQPVGQE